MHTSEHRDDIATKNAKFLNYAELNDNGNWIEYRVVCQWTNCPFYCHTRDDYVNYIKRYLEIQKKVP